MRTLRQNLEDVDFTPGILDDVFDVMKNKVKFAICKSETI